MANNKTIIILSLILALAVTVVVGMKLFPKIYLPGSIIQEKTEAFREYLVSVSSDSGDRLLVAEIKNNIETTISTENKEVWTGITIGTSTVSVKAPVVYKYYIQINDKWDVKYDASMIFVKAPNVKLLKPASVVTRGIQVFKNNSLLSFDADTIADNALKELTDKANKNGESAGLLRIAQASARKAVADFVKKWIVKEELGNKIIIIQFPEEVIEDKPLINENKTKT